MRDDQQKAQRLARVLDDAARSFRVTDATTALTRFRERTDYVARPTGGAPSHGDRGNRPMARRWLAVAAVAMVVVGVAAVVGRQEPSDEAVVSTSPALSPSDIASTAGEDWVVAIQGEHVFPHPPGWIITTDVACPSGPVVLIAASRDVDPCVATRDVPMTGEALSFIAATEVPGGWGATSGGGDGGGGVRVELGSTDLIKTVIHSSESQLVAGGSDHPNQEVASAVAYRYTTVDSLAAVDGPARPPEWPASDWSDSPAERLRELRSSVDYPVQAPAEVPAGWHIETLDGNARYSMVELGFGPRRYEGIPVDLLLCSSPADNPTCAYDAIDYTHHRTYAGTSWECGFVRMGVRAPWWCRRALPDGSWVSFSVASGTVRADHLDQVLRALTDGP